MSKQANPSKSTPTPDPRFRLLAIQPHKDCGQRFHKVLTPGKVYSFYQDYTFIQKDQDAIEPSGPTGKVTAIEYTSSFPEDLYDLGDLKVSLSAVVGENGSGKSTLIELLFYAVYVLSTTLKGEKEPLMETIDEKYEKEAKEIGKRRDELKAEKNQLAVADDLQKLKDHGVRWERVRGQAKEDHEDILDGYWCSVFYLSGGDIYELLITGRLNKEEQKKAKKKHKVKKNRLHLLSLKQFQKDQMEGTPFVQAEAATDEQARLKEVLDTFFYTVAINYSHYALNSKNIGLWIQALFHKNDAYQSPLVISPMRYEGNFDINDEIGFSQQRLLSNIIIRYKGGETLIDLTDKLYFSKVQYSIKDSYLKVNQKDSTAILENLVSAVFGETGLNVIKEKIRDSFPFKNELTEYGLEKVDKVLSTYERYKPLGKKGSQEFFEYLTRDYTHVSIKLRQIASFVYMMCTKPELAEKWETFYNVRISQRDKAVSNVLDMNLKDFEDWLGGPNSISPGEDKLGSYSIMFLLPPPIFEINIVLDNKDGIEVNDLNSLSSGEQQMIHTIQSIAYQLININSVFNIDYPIDGISFEDTNRKESINPRDNVLNIDPTTPVGRSYRLSAKSDAFQQGFRYKNVNIILDEIELYFHPAWQQRYVSKLLKDIERLNLKHIKYINILFSTHSPFILSDLPRSNILYLKVPKAGEEDSKAEQRLREAKGQHTFGANIHDLLSHSFYMNEGFMGEVAKEKIKRLIEFLTEEKHKDYWDDQKARIFIGQIGEPMLRDSLQELFHKKYPHTEWRTDEEIRAEIERMQNILKERGGEE